MNAINWNEQLDQLTREFKQTFGSLTPAQLNWKPNPDSWSIAQNIDHVRVINETYFPVIKSVREGNYQAPFIAKLGFMVRWLGGFILSSVQPDRKRKMKTFPIWEPSQSELPADILSRFEQQQAELKRIIADSQDLVEKRTVISSPANRNIVYKLETAFDIIVAHERRHLEQAKEVLGQLKL